jgi:hypothetical protein
MLLLQDRLKVIQGRISEAEKSYKRSSGSVTLLAVSKKQSVADITTLLQHGHTHFGENQLQEALGKIKVLPKEGIDWHFIGPVQSNKVKEIATNFEWVHSIDRLSIAEGLNKHRPASLPPLNVCVQVNISNEASKSGVKPEEVLALAQQVAELPRLHLRGLMAVPARMEEVDQQRAAFRAVRSLYEQLIATGLALDTLSMGMSEDMEAAIAEGSNIVRVGSAIFGAREYKA